MNTSTATRRPVSKKDVLRQQAFTAFWRFSSQQATLTDSQRLHQIKAGFPADLAQVLRLAFGLQDHQLKTLLNASFSTLERRRRGHRSLDPVTSERLGRIAAVSHLAEEIFETPVIATYWMSVPNKALDGSMPIMLCETELGAKQVRRVLQTLAWGGAA
jgi:putative toxin-antitoxin system antitoxin component (TIGR02293 family)